MILLFSALVYFKAIENHKTDWLRQYHPDCHLRAMEYAAAYEDPHTETIFENIQSFNFTRDVIAGVYTVYPYVEIPDSVTEQQGLRRLLNKQLRYILDPAYHITVEVVAMEKTFGSRVFRNVHGRLIEKNLVEFNPIRTAYYDIGEGSRQAYGKVPRFLEWYEIVPEAFPILFFRREPHYRDKNHPYIPKPNRDLISFASYDFPEGKEKTKVNKEITVCTSETGDIKASEHPYDPVLVNIDDRFGDIESKFVYGDNSYFHHAVNSMRLGFDDDYCFHKPGTIRFYAHRVTYCAVGLAGAGRVLDDIFGSGGNVDSQGEYNHNTKFEEGNYHSMTTCDYQKIWDELNLLKNTLIVSKVNTKEHTYEMNIVITYDDMKAGLGLNEEEEYELWEVYCKTFTGLNKDGKPTFTLRRDHQCTTFDQTMDSSRIHNDGGDFPGFKGDTTDYVTMNFFTEYMLGFIYDIDPDQTLFPTIYKLFLEVAYIHLREDNGDVHLANK